MRLLRALCGIHKSFLGLVHLGRLVAAGKLAEGGNGIRELIVEVICQAVYSVSGIFAGEVRKACIARFYRDAVVPT
jgi:hypothetical protein